MRKIAFLLLAISLVSSAFATQPNPSQRQRDLIEQIIVVTKIDETMRAYLDAYLQQIQSQSEKLEESEEKKDFDRFRELLREKVDYKEWARAIYMPLYAKTFTEEQLADLLAFYKTPTGQRFIVALPEMQKEAMKLAQELFVPQIKAISDRVQEEHKKRVPWEQTMRDIRSVVAAAEAYAIDHDEKYPDVASWSELGKLLSPTYIREMPEKDAWGNHYEYIVSEDKAHYRVISAGADGSFEWDSRHIVSRKEGEMKLSDNPNDDLIYQDGMFVQVPRASQPHKKD
jgi:hypothetical protein